MGRSLVEYLRENELVTRMKVQFVKIYDTNSSAASQRTLRSKKEA